MPICHMIIQNKSLHQLKMKATPSDHHHPRLTNGNKRKNIFREKEIGESVGDFLRVRALKGDEGQVSHLDRGRGRNH